jgi:hypothetical protein
MRMSPLSVQWRQSGDSQNNLRGVWKQWIAKLAMEYHTLMDAGLGFSATNLHALNPSDSLIS